MNLAAISHRPSKEFIYPQTKDILVLQLITAREDIQEATLLYWERYETAPSKRIVVTLRVSLRDAYHDYFRASVKTTRMAAYTRYCFRLRTGTQTVWFGARGFQSHDPGITGNFFEFLWPNPDDGYRAPDWSKTQVYYQIFPDRFCNADPNLSLPNTVPWGTAPTRENVMGGDIPGIIEKLDYIKDLGVTCIYTTPIFYATSNHKYDTVNYYEIDPCFGTKDDLKRLVDEVHARGMRIILDGVFNHCGYYWVPFLDVVAKGPHSAYKDWFFIHDYPIQPDPKIYDCVGHYQWMPKINLSNPEAKRYFINVGKYWIREFGIDGWRLDVADEVPMSFWEAFSAELKALKPDCLLLGETWGDAQRLLCENRLDSAMNYLFQDAVTLWLAEGKISAAQFDDLINRSLSLYPEEVDLRMYNLLDSHDTARFLFACNGDIKRYRLAVALQMTFPGCPAIFYGDEIGLSGPNDPGCRMAMEWDEARQNLELFNWFKACISIRQNSISLLEGSYRTIICDDDANLFGFCRITPQEISFVLINAGDSDCRQRIRIPCISSDVWREAISGQRLALQSCCEAYSPSCLTKYEGILDIELPAYSVKIFQQTMKEKVSL